MQDNIACVPEMYNLHHYIYFDHKQNKRRKEPPSSRLASDVLGTYNSVSYRNQTSSASIQLHVRLVLPTDAYATVRQLAAVPIASTLGRYRHCRRLLVVLWLLITVTASRNF